MGSAETASSSLTVRKSRLINATPCGLRISVPPCRSSSYKIAALKGAGALLVTRGGKVALAVEGRGKRVVAAAWMDKLEIMKAKEILAQHLRGEKGARYLMLPELPDIRPA